MTLSKIAITIPDDVLKLAKQQVKKGRAKSLSALISEAVDEKVRRSTLNDILDQMDAEHGKPTREDRAWAKRVVRRSSSTRGR